MNAKNEINCHECGKSIPLDTALTVEGGEYVLYFCGLECYQHFQNQAEQKNEMSNKIQNNFSKDEKNSK